MQNRYIKCFVHVFLNAYLNETHFLLSFSMIIKNIVFHMLNFS